MTKKNFAVYESIRASKYFRSGEWFRAADLASQLGRMGITSKSIARYLSEMRDGGELEMGSRCGGAHRIWRKARGITPHMLFRVEGGYTNEQIGISDASKRWH